MPDLPPVPKNRKGIVYGRGKAPTRPPPPVPRSLPVSEQEQTLKPPAPRTAMQIDYDEWINGPGGDPSGTEDWCGGYIVAAKRGAVHTLALLESRDQRIREAFAEHRWSYGAGRPDCSCGAVFVDAVPSVWSAYLEHLLDMAAHA